MRDPDRIFVEPTDQPDDLSLDNFRLSLLRGTEERVTALDRLALRVRENPHVQPGDLVDAIRLMAQQLRHHKSMISMEIAAGRRKQTPPIPWWKRLFRYLGR